MKKFEDMFLVKIANKGTPLIELYFHYCNNIWGNCEQGLLNKLQALQNRVSRIVIRTRYSDAVHETILKKLHWLS